MDERHPRRSSVWSAGSDRRKTGLADVYLSEREVAVVNAAGALWRHDADSLAVALEALGSHLHEVAPKRVRVWLGAALCRPVRIAPIVGGVSRKERARLAEMAAITQSGLKAPCRVSIDTADAFEDGVATVVEEAVLAALDRTLAAAQLSASSIQPWWAHVLASALRAQPALRAPGVSEGKAMTILVGEGRRFSSAHALCPVESPEAGSAAFARTLISGMIPEDDALAVRLDWMAVDAPDARGFGDGDVVFGPWITRQGASS